MIDFKNILFYLLILPVTGVILLLFIPSSNHNLIKKVGFRISCITFVLSCYIWTVFNKSIGTFQLVTDNTWISILNLNLNLGVDGISLFFVLLTTLLIALCILTSWNSITFNLREYLIIILYFF
jgi:NADH-quinone oxidoreductase subunit M